MRYPIGKAVHLVAHGLESGKPVEFHIVDLETKVAQSGGSQTLKHDTGGSLLLANHENRALVREGIADDVDDGLRLAGSGRTVHDQAGRLPCLPDDLFLREID